MLNTIKTLSRSLTLGCALALPLAAPAAAETRGGGVVWDYSDGCSPDRWAVDTEMVRVRFRPAERNGGLSSLTLFYSWGGAVNFRSAANFEPGPTRWIARGYGVFGEFFGLERPRQRIRVLERSVITPWRGSFDKAEEIMLQLRIGNFDGSSRDCFATVSMVLTTQDTAPGAAPVRAGQFGGGRSEDR